MSVSQPQEYYNNQALFSDHYLAERMNAHPEWGEDIGGAFSQLQDLYRGKRPFLDGLNEAQTEEEFIRPVLEILGFAYIPQTGFTHAGRQLRPDYALFTDRTTKDEAYQFLQDEGKFYPRALAICDAKYWGRPLDFEQRDDPRDEFKNTNPSFQIVNYLVGTDVDWGILTNGRLWRLYYQKARSRASTYYEVDLARILDNGDGEAFRYFYHFFRRAALVKDPATGRNFLERVYEGSATYALQVQEELKGLIFEKIVPILAKGFVEWRRTERGIAQETEDSLRQIFTATLTLLYRLLFLLYAEARELLPVSDLQRYYPYSLTRIKRDAVERLNGGRALSTVSDDVWNDLAALFRIIDRGDPALNVPTYNGGLFDRRSPKNAFLEEHRIADYYLVQALDHLTRRDDPDTGERRFIDYKDLDVRHLGSIYEGLLEFHLRIAQEDLAAVKVQGVEVYKPLSEVKESRRLEVVRKGELYLENDKGQRKATGSYYTPDYIVKYIVANTLGPIIEERARQFAEVMAEIEACEKRLRRAKSPGTTGVGRNELADLEQRAVQTLLDIKVCDPAMGSGHFLVEAVAYLTDRIIDILNQYPENPVLTRLATIRKQILANLEERGIRIDPAVLTDTNLLKRMVMKRCIYGVDLNPMAVELAKLSLWLDSFTVGAPLSFLDHHLKVGNSLIGARVQEVRAELEKTAAGQYDMFGGPFAGLLTATELMRGVGLRTDATFDEVQESAGLYADFERAILPYKRVLDLWVSQYFGNKRADEFLRLYGTKALQAVMNEGQGLSPEYRQAIQTARRLWEEKRFFHWDLEFPEVFIDLERSDWKQNPGFDVVVGNPPYVSTKVIPLDDKAYFKQEFESATGQYDLYGLMIERSLEVLKEDAWFGFITSDTFLENVDFRALRSLILDSARIEALADFGETVFEDSSLDVAVTILNKRQKEKLRDSNKVRIFIGAADEMQDPNKWHLLSQGAFRRLEGHCFKIRLREEVFALIQKLQRKSVHLGTLVNMTRGIETGSNDDSIVAAPKSGYEEILVGQDIARYEISFANRYMPFDESDPSKFKTRDVYTQPKILVQRIRNLTLERRLIATLDTRGYFTLNTLRILTLKAEKYSLFYLLTIINSTLANFYFRHLFNNKDIYAYQLAQVPIRRIEFTTPPEERRALVEEGKGLVEAALTPALAALGRPLSQTW
ncbi:MAG: N-6 DNA methylase, partial [Chloroflexi bacterium]|nr:N-6 DNA methylase [Chloroflexota bacterium]